MKWAGIIEVICAVVFFILIIHAIKTQATTYVYNFMGIWLLITIFILINMAMCSS
jgi:hypothetical protein